MLMPAPTAGGINPQQFHDFSMTSESYPFLPEVEQNAVLMHKV